MADLPGNKIIVIALDGMPFSMLQHLSELKVAPMQSELYREGVIVPMTTTLPPISSVAWGSFATGADPGAHGVTGFVDRQKGGYEPFVPTSGNLRLSTVFEHLTANGLRICSIGVPLTYPVKKINGIMVAGFLAPSLGKAVYPQEEERTLRSQKYRLDIDAWKARKSHESLYRELPESLMARLSTARYYAQKESWDFFMLHVIETDRLHHFLWRQIMDGEKTALALFGRIYSEIDEFLNWIRRAMGGNASLIIMSDHGFVPLKRDFYLNRWLQGEGYMKLANERATNLTGMDMSSRAFSMAPGRIYLHLVGKCPNGVIKEGAAADSLKQEITGRLLAARDPIDGARIVKEVVDMRIAWRDADFDGSPLQLPDLIAVPEDGYEIKGEPSAGKLFGEDDFTGMHAYGDAFLYLNGERPGERPEVGADITDVMPTICGMLGVQPPAHVQGKDLLKDKVLYQAGDASGI